MDQLLEQIIVDFHGQDLPRLTLREVQLPAIKNKIHTIIGMRRTGKTYYLFQIMQQLIKQGINKSAILYINFEDERLLPVEAKQLHKITDIYYRLHSQLHGQTCYFFFDEIQNVSGWEKFIRRLKDQFDVEIYITGSSSKLLSKEIATSLRGRSISTEIFSFSFTESLDYAGINHEFHTRPIKKQRSLLHNRFLNYLDVGGFAEVQDTDTLTRYRILQEYVDVVILRDIVERHNVSNVIALRYLIRHFLHNPATTFTVNRFYNDLKSQGISCSKNTLHEFMEHLTETYIIYPVHIHSHSERAKRVNPKKVYIIDTGFFHAFSQKGKTDLGHQLENFVYMSLRRHVFDIQYYITQSGYEIDFIASHPTQKTRLIQVCLHLNDEKTRQREIRALTDGIKEQKLGESLVITLDSEEDINTEYGKITAVPAWLWNLDMDKNLYTQGAQS